MNFSPKNPTAIKKRHTVRVPLMPEVYLKDVLFALKVQVFMELFKPQVRTLIKRGKVDLISSSGGYNFTLSTCSVKKLFTRFGTRFLPDFLLIIPSSELVVCEHVERSFLQLYQLQQGCAF